MDWSSIKKGRDTVKGMFPRVLKVPIIPDANRLLYELIPEGGSILDVGANDRKLEGYLKGRPKKLDYKSFDIDRRYKHDYYSLDDITERFDTIVSFEVIEHLGVEEAVELVGRLYGLLKDSGTLVLSTPNVFHPTIFWRDCTHRTGFRYNELAGILSSVGFNNLSVYRVFRGSIRDRIVIFFYNPLLRLMNMDYCGRIIVTGEK